MSVLDAAMGKLDQWQRRHRPVAFVVAVIKKSGDDDSGHLVALLTYYAFISTFPLLLALTGGLGLVLRGHPALQHKIQQSALTEFPIIGDQLHSQLGISTLSHSTPALVVGTVGALLGGRGLANATQYVFNTLWSVPFHQRPTFPNNLLRSIALLLLLGAAAAGAAVVASLAGIGDGVLGGWPTKIVLTALWAVLDSALFLAIFRIAIAKTVATRDLVLGAILSGLAWLVLLNAAGIVVKHYLHHAQALAGLFGIVLGLLAWFGLQAAVTVFAVEADVVRSKQLWPRGLRTENPTAADRRSFELLVQAQVRRADQTISVVVDEPAGNERMAPEESTLGG